MKTTLVLSAAAIALASAAGHVAADPQGKEREVISGDAKRFKGCAKSLDALREAVWRRNAYLNPKRTHQEVEDLVAYLNLTYYRFPTK